MVYVVRTARKRPNEIVVPWPNGVTTDVAGRAAQAFALELRRLIGDDSIRSIAALCGVNHETVRGILEGRVWPDMHTVAHLEDGLDFPLWPRKAPNRVSKRHRIPKTKLFDF